MRIRNLMIRNFKSIHKMEINTIENALILVGQNNAGKTTILDAIRAVGGSYRIGPEDFKEDFPNIEIGVSLEITQKDLRWMNQNRIISRYHRFDAWMKEFMRKLPTFRDGILSFRFIAKKDGSIRYTDGMKKDNPYISEVFPKIYYVDAERNLSQLQEDILLMQEDELLKQLRSDSCLFEPAKKCNHCFSCIGLLSKKSVSELNAFETTRLLDYKLYQLNLDAFAVKVNHNFHKNGGQEQILYSMNRNIESMLSVTTEICHPAKKFSRPVERMGKGMRSVYMLSLLETYAEMEKHMPSIIIMEEPGIFLHPKLQKVSGDILYRLARQNQVIFSTHSPNLLPNFNSRQIRQVIMDENGCTRICQKTDISAILDDLGLMANDLMNVNFVFIVEGKQDKSRLPLLLRKYYSEICDRDGNLSRVAIITTNSCTNIKTYANLKYMNQIYLKDQFIMIRDGDGADREKLGRQLCRYYEERNAEDADKLPRVTSKNVLILKYYSFENYFLNPVVMKELGIIPSEDAFYETLLSKWKEYLHRIRSGRHLTEVIGRTLETVEDVKQYMEEIRVYLRGHNLFDIFYGPFRDREQELLTRYIELAPREDFADILDSIDNFIYFENRRKEKDYENRAAE